MSSEALPIVLYPYIFFMVGLWSIQFFAYAATIY